MPRSLADLEADLDAGRITEEQYAHERAVILGLPLPSKAPPSASVPAAGPGESLASGWQALSVPTEQAIPASGGTPSSSAYPAMPSYTPPAVPSGYPASTATGQVVGAAGSAAAAYPAPTYSVPTGTDQQPLYVYEENPTVSGCCYANVQDPRSVVVANTSCGRCLAPNMATRGGKRCLSIPFIIVFVVIGLLFQILPRTGVFSWWKSGDDVCYQESVTDCGLKWCMTEDCDNDETNAYETKAACEALFSSRNASCSPYRQGSCFIRGANCNPSGYEPGSQDGPDFAYYECLGWIVDKCKT